ncbi:hypothetical protein NT6N_17980 [Oceaniferula spumae]|uniref:Methyltransferase type 11 domain-containing protein n=1 Tax=Oceaniferula spumae TaxID=2979115 RepID=A0AAT9FLD3_9BACT
MGLDNETTRYLLADSKKTIRGKSVLTIARQTLQMGESELDRLLKEFGIPAEAQPNIDWKSKRRPYAEPLFSSLGALSVNSMDFSDYESADLIHDLNDPIPDKWKKKFDFVCESGSLEHIFNLPVAVKNCMEMVKVGGYLTWAGPANNFFGHGFYQFSPELLYRILSKENGYKIIRMIAIEYDSKRRWYRVHDPAVKHDRIKLISKHQISVIVTAERVSEEKIFLRNPQQSDYLEEWNDTAHQIKLNITPKKKHNMRAIKDYLISNHPRLAQIGRTIQQSGLNREYSFKNPKSFEPLSKPRKAGHF